MDPLDFTEEETREQLALLGYKNISTRRLLEFKQDLDELLLHGDRKSLTSPALPLPALSNSNKLQTEASRPSPPAYTKERDHGRQNRNYGHWHLCDSYALHSVAPRLQMPPGAPNRLQVEPDTDNTLHQTLNDSCTTSPDNQGRRFIRRKVLRKHKGQSFVCDESVYSEDSDAVSCPEERLAELDLSSPAQHDFETENEDTTSQSETLSSEAEGVSMSAFESYIRGMTRSRIDGNIRPKPKSFIRPVMNQQTIKKTDPVAKYFQYKQLWDTFKLPGESDRRALRQEIKEQLAYQPPPPKPRRVYVPNTYIVPTEKKRSALCWEIRNDMANGVLPHKFNYRF